ncbi:NRT1/ PTR family 2.7-like protein [Tanacetum coccineum]
MAIGLASIGIGGTRFTMTTMGADQFDDSNDSAIYFNWYFCAFYVANAISLTATIYIEDNVSWTVGFGICVASNLVGLILFLSGKNFYRHNKPKGSPFTSIARVIVAAVKKRRVSSRNHEYNYHINGASTTIPSNSFRFLNHGALKIEADVQKLKSWSLSSVEEVEDLKTLIRIMPLWSTGILLSALIGMLSNFTVLQALTMDRHLFSTHFKIPAASYLFFNTIATSISLSILDLAMVSSAFLEVQRLHVARVYNLMGSTMGATTIIPFLALWLMGPLTVLGISEALHFPAQVSVYYQEFPTSLCNTSTAMIALLIASGFYVSTASQV